MQAERMHYPDKPIEYAQDEASPTQKDSVGLRVYIAKITFTTLIDHFTSLHALQHWFIVTNL